MAPPEVYSTVERVISAMGCTVVIQGGARGIDSMAKKAAERLSIENAEYPANWADHGRWAAGPIRNQQMLDEGRPDVVVAFHPKSGITKGTADMVNRSRRAGIPTYCIEF